MNYCFRLIIKIREYNYHVGLASGIEMLLTGGEGGLG